jgi:hypothetical protein
LLLDRQEAHAEQLRLQKEREREAKDVEEKAQMFAKRAEERLRNQKPLHERLQKHYEDTILAAEKKRAEEVMHAKHERARPMGFDELNEHDLKVTQKRQEAEIKHEEERKLRAQELKATTGPYFRPKVLDLVQAEDKARAQKEKIRLAELTEYYEKKERYGMLVREMYAPKIDPKKETEIKRRLDKLHPKRPAPIKDPLMGHPPKLSEIANSPIPARPYHHLGPKSPAPLPKREFQDYLTPARLSREEKEAANPELNQEKRFAKWNSRAVRCFIPPYRRSSPQIFVVTLASVFEAALPNPQCLTFIPLPRVVTLCCFPQSRAATWLSANEEKADGNLQLMHQVADAYVNMIGSKLAMLKELAIPEDV